MKAADGPAAAGGPNVAGEPKADGGGKADDSAGGKTTGDLVREQGEGSSGGPES